MVFKGLYSTTNDPKNGPQMILDRKLEWFGLRLLDNRVMFIITTKSIKQKKNLTSQIIAKKKVITVKLCSINETIVNANKK